MDREVNVVVGGRQSRERGGEKERGREVVWEEGGGWVMPKDGRRRGEGVEKGDRKRDGVVVAD